MDYITTKEAVKNWGITYRMVVYYCSAEMTKKAKKMGNTWLVSVDDEKLADGRYRGSKVEEGENK